MAAPPGNTNGQKSGITTSRRAAAAGFRTRRLPKGYRYVANQAGAYAGALYDAAKEAFGEISRNHLEVIEAASAWHQHGLFVLRELRISYDTLKPETRAQMSAEYAKSVQKRVDQVKLLGIPDVKPIDPFNGTLTDEVAE